MTRSTISRIPCSKASSLTTRPIRCRRAHSSITCIKFAMGTLNPAISSAPPTLIAVSKSICSAICGPAHAPTGSSSCDGSNGISGGSSSVPSGIYGERMIAQRRGYETTKFPSTIYSWHWIKIAFCKAWGIRHLIDRGWSTSFTVPATRQRFTTRSCPGTNPPLPLTRAVFRRSRRWKQWLQK